MWSALNPASGVESVGPGRLEIIALGPNSVAWFEDEIDEYLASCPRVSYAPAPEPLGSA